MLRRRTLLKSNTVNGNDSNTLLLLHFDNSLVNSAIGGSSIGNPVSLSTASYDTSSYKFGSASFYSNTVVYFIGTSPESIIRTAMQSDFTIDYWAKIDATTAVNPDICLLGGTSYQDQAVITVRHYDEPGYGLYVQTKSTVDNGQSYIINRIIKVSSFAQSGGWNHYAYVRKDNVLNLYVNGTLLYNWAFNPTIPSTQQHVSFGGFIDGTTSRHTLNRFDEIRFSNIARWDADFTPSTTPYA